MKIYLVHLIRSRRIIENPADLSLLENLERQGIQHEYQCRSGYCGSCRVRLKKGRVSYPQPPLAFLQEDEILPCCCRLESDLEIDL
ncbi:ferredoxin [Mesocricetibacter intestinalis]|uniref:Ferredoxin n=1 Tax=Mesocricetibacter intestinalis TaxID=1521930 RepID=A0A4R6VBB1_9PAST|nr:class I ribonucleotide reductase maintenance protein YfaE [Mesocricetibacter intestinalis]TDQ57421.1 ferredoxin [Mesocricetibacter intestinalis]